MSSEQDFLYQRKYAVSSDGDNAPQGAISAGGMYNKNTEWMQNSYTSVSCWLLPTILESCCLVLVHNAKVSCPLCAVKGRQSEGPCLVCMFNVHCSLRHTISAFSTSHSARCEYIRTAYSSSSTYIEVRLLLL